MVLITFLSLSTILKEINQYFSVQGKILRIQRVLKDSLIEVKNFVN